jgi:hypothetical protein
MTISDQEEQAERRRVLFQDADVRNGDTNAYIDQYAPELTPWRSLRVRMKKLSSGSLRQKKARQHLSCIHAGGNR